MPTAKAQKHGPLVVIYGDEEYQKSAALQRVLDELLPPDVDRAMALVEFDGGQVPDQGGPEYATVHDELSTLPFLADRRVVVIRDADKFVSACREKLERYVPKAAATGTLVLVCRSFPKTTRLAKAATAAGCKLLECKRLSGEHLVDFVQDEARGSGKRISPATAARLVELVGADQSLLVREIEKLALYALERDEITDEDLRAQVGLSREEKIFVVMDAAAAGRLADALALWQDVLATDPAAAYRALGGIAYVLRRWLKAHELAATGLAPRAIAPKVMMWKRERALEALMRRLPDAAVKRQLAALAELDAEVKSGSRSIEAGVEALLVALAAPAA